ncbi:MAG: sce7725 family protein [Rhodobacter sp.]|nr:sce7725 family protein [Rhodobacter sp.]
MYCPCLYGKQNELIAVRETAPVMAAAKFVPVIMPVNRDMSGLRRCLKSVDHEDGRVVVVVNPERGALADDPAPVKGLLDGEFTDTESILRGILLTGTTTRNDVVALCDSAGERPVAFVHAGFQEANALVAEHAALASVHMHVFMEKDCGEFYRKKFPVAEGVRRVLVRDGFRKRRNRDYPPVEFYSDLHATYRNKENVNGFGDFLTVGDQYSDSGGPAYAVAIHLTHIDPDMDDGMYVRHFVSDERDTPTNPGGKFGEALAKLIGFLDSEAGGAVYETAAIGEFRELHERQHYPGLGYVKKLSMTHHIETLARYLNGNPPDAT